MTDVIRLHHVEPVHLDRHQLEVLVDDLGAVGADKVVGVTLEEVAGALSCAMKHYRAGEIGAMRSNLRALIRAARQVGMTSLVRVGEDVLSLSDTFDGAAFGATTERLERIGESSLVAFWDLQDLSI